MLFKSRVFFLYCQEFKSSSWSVNHGPFQATDNNPFHSKRCSHNVICIRCVIVPLIFYIFAIHRLRNDLWELNKHILLYLPKSFGIISQTLWNCGGKIVYTLNDHNQNKYLFTRFILRFSYFLNESESIRRVFEGRCDIFKMCEISSVYFKVLFSWKQNNTQNFWYFTV